MKKAVLVSVALCAAAIVFSALLFKSSAGVDKFRRSPRAIPNRYVVVLNDDVAVNGDDAGVESVVNDVARSHQGTVGKVFTRALKGYAAEMTEESALALSSDPRVKYVEEDGEVQPQATQYNATWGISRIDQRNYAYPLDTNYDHNATGQGVNAYIIDTGIMITHPDFEGRASNAVNTSGDNTPVDQCNGHGTHVAGTVGSRTYGVAKSVRLFSVRVFPCWGGASVSNVVAGVDWVSRHAVAPAVANMSLGGAYSDALEQAVRTSILNNGITYSVAAGNSNRNACQESPAHLAEAITVGMTDQRDYRADISNFGSCVDIFAPGAGIASTGSMPNYPYEHIMSGTSTATPHVTGVAALYLEMNPSASPSQVRDAIVNNGTQGILTDVGEGSPNLFLYSSFISGGGGGGASCPGTNYTGMLPGTGGFDYQSSVSGFQANGGRYTGILRVPTGAQFRLNIESKKGSRWTTLSSSPGTGVTENLELVLKRGTYRWKVESLSGSGIYSLCSVNP